MTQVTKVSLSIRPEAEADLTDAYRFYEECRDGLGADFLFCVEEAPSKISHSPDSFQAVHKNIRGVLIHRFPYGIFYISDGSQVVVLAVLHFARNPSTWKSRS